jgi:hypothetical protein
VRIRRSQQRHHITIVSLAFVISFGASFLAVLTTNFPFSVLSRSPRPLAIDGKFGLDHRTGKIVFDPIDRAACQETTFDNRTGNLMAATKTCSDEVDRNGLPLPKGTIRRLDAISRSFYGPLVDGFVPPKCNLKLA